MSHSLIELLPNWAFFIIFPVLAWVCLALVTWALKKVFSQTYGSEDPDSDVVDTATSNAMSAVYVVLGFVLVLVMTTANEVDGNIAKEASQIESLDRLLMMEGSQSSLAARQSLRVYTESIVNNEWKRLSEGTGSQKTTTNINQLFQDINKIKPDAGRQLALFSEIIRKCDEISQSRDMRILSSQSRLPSLFWALSFFTLLGVVVIAGVRLMHPTKIRVIVLGTQVAMVALTFTAVMILDLPYLGETKSSPDPFIKVIQVMGNR